MKQKPVKIKTREKQDNCAYLMIAPAYLIFVLFVIVPIIMVVYYSFTNYDMTSTADFVGLRNYKRMFSDKLFWKAVRNTGVYSFFSVIPQLTLALILSTALFRRSRLVKVFRSGIYMPYVISMVCTSMIWMWIYDPSAGVLNVVIKALGGKEQTWLSDPKLAMFCIIVAGIWRSVGYSTVIYLSGMTGIQSEYYEAARIDGANVFQQFLHITFPLLRSSTIFLLITTTIHSFAVFEQVNIMTGGGPVNATTTIVHQIYMRGFQSSQMGYASAMGVFLLIACCILTYLVFRFDKEDF